jgi:hypothetical protein
VPANPLGSQAGNQAGTAEFQQFAPGAQGKTSASNPALKIGIGIVVSCADAIHETAMVSGTISRNRFIEGSLHLSPDFYLPRVSVLASGDISILIQTAASEGLFSPPATFQYA